MCHGSYSIGMKRGSNPKTPQPIRQIALLLMGYRPTQVLSSSALSGWVGSTQERQCAMQVIPFFLYVTVWKWFGNK